MKRISFDIEEDDLKSVMLVLVPHMTRMHGFAVADVAGVPAVEAIRLEAPPARMLKTHRAKRATEHPRTKRFGKVPESRDNIREAIRRCLDVDAVTPAWIRAKAKEFEVPTRVIHNVLFAMKTKEEIEAFKPKRGGLNSYRRPPLLRQEVAESA